MSGLSSALSLFQKKVAPAREFRGGSGSLYSQMQPASRT